MNPITAIFRTRLKQIRTERGIGQVEIAKAIGVSKSVVSFWETGKCEPTLTPIIKLANFFDIDIDYLVGRKEQ
ncbi:MAG: helix-turn-helix transcriptional regulator [Firmicutes bacterium]|nr:helix-turn-helix transcriptional regulator [Bacillota bacterium]